MMENGWRLKEIEIKFERGYSHREKEEEKHDRYVGKISFENGDGESFNLKIPKEMTTRYMDLMREDIIKTADELGSKIAESIRLIEKPKSDPK
jgi:hypothetical protein